MSTNISVLINTFNEEKNIRNCLESVKWANEIIIVDMYSDDRTVEIAREYTDKIYMHKRMGYADPARQFALEKASNEWILVVDADEIVPIELRNRLIEIAESGKYDAVLIPHINYFFGYKMKGTGWGPLQDMHVRFFRKNKVSYTDRVHAFTQLDPSARVFKINDENCGFVHFGMDSLEQYLEKFNRYTTIEAINDFDEGKKFSLLKVLYQSFMEVFKRLIYQKAYKDGLQGIVLVFLMVLYRIVAGFKLYLMYKYNEKNTKQKVRNIYQKIAEEVIDEYKENK